ncbi:MAG: hypothetical protein A2Y57_01955 [Candidatus Woykebacteria bacterium RBG_13_40_7b]|uniref:Gcp-like domain-containing protein n=1 Tax=Candidatus Woykebacteria bacterium RBG_13_40_7b TaxID=1802594 RepID=A0A1G1WAF2_9BACT|nr:MAG: hypothetical protein A2Y57_01955 [Candidatus Woykebacteria bacterium RBG_13_40_7b]
MKLLIDTREAKVAKITVFKDRKTIAEVVGTSPLITIEKALNKLKLKLTDLDEIDYEKGPGSFTGLKVGAAISNTLNWLLKGKNKFEEPTYE